MNSINNIDYVRSIVEGKFPVGKTIVTDQYQVSFEMNKEDVHRVLSTLKSEGWIQLSYLSAIDWIAENQFELVYIVMNWEKPVYIQIRTRLDRENAEMESILPIYPGCKYYEREAHEFFGIKFPGNPDYEKQLVLENWDDMPPMLKDFDPRAYSDAHFPKRVYTENFVNLNNEKSSKQKKREARAERIAKVGKGGKK